MPYPFTFNGRTYTLEDFQGTNYVDGIPDLMHDAAQHFGLPYNTTSTSRNTIAGNPIKNFTLKENIPYTVGTPLRISDVNNPSQNWIDAIVVLVTGARIRVQVVGYSGDGLVTNWNITLGGCATAVKGIVPVTQGGTGTTSLQALANELGVLTRTEADRLYTSATGILGIYRGGTNADNIIDARKNLELYSKTEVDARIQQLGGGLKGTPEEMRNTLDVYSTGQSDGRYLRSGLTLGISAGGTGATTVVDARNNLDVYGRSETFGKFETYNRDQVYNRRDSDNRYLIKGVAVPVSSGGTGGTTVQEAQNNLNVYGKDSTYRRIEVYNKNETYGKAEVYNRTESDRRYFVQGVTIPLASGGTGGTTAATARRNLDVYGKTETYNKNEVYAKTETYNRTEIENRIAGGGGGGGGGLQGTPEEMRNTLDVYSTGQSDGRYLRSDATLGVSSGGTGGTNAVEARQNLDVYGRSETFSKIETYSRDQVYNRRDSDNRYLPKGASIPITSGGTGGTTVQEAQNNLNVYGKDSTYRRIEVYNKNETYGKAEVYNRTESDARYFVTNPLSAPLRVEQGGTGAITPDRARDALDLYSKTEVDNKLNSFSNYSTGTADTVDVGFFMYNKEFTKLLYSKVTTHNTVQVLTNHFRYVSYSAGIGKNYIICKGSIYVEDDTVFNYFKTGASLENILNVSIRIPFTLWNTQSKSTILPYKGYDFINFKEAYVDYYEQYGDYNRNVLNSYFYPTHSNSDNLTMIKKFFDLSESEGKNGFYVDFEARGFSAPYIKVFIHEGG